MDVVPLDSNLPEMDSVEILSKKAERSEGELSRLRQLLIQKESILQQLLCTEDPYVRAVIAKVVGIGKEPQKEDVLAKRIEGLEKSCALLIDQSDKFYIALKQLEARIDKGAESTPKTA